MLLKLSSLLLMSSVLVAAYTDYRKIMEQADPSKTFDEN